MDATYRSELRELNELNYTRFEAKLEQRIAEVKAELGAGLAGLELKLAGQLTGLEAKLLGLESRFGALEARLIKWMFLFWATALGTLVALQKF